MNKDSRMRSLYLSGEWVKICGLLKFTLWWVLDWIWLHIPRCHWFDALVNV